MTRRILVLLVVGLAVALEASSTHAAGPIAASLTTVLDGPSVLRQSPEGVQAVLGEPERTTVVEADDFRLPAGGTSRVYRDRGMRVEVDFDRGRSTTAVIGFPDAETAPRSYEGALQAINLPSSRTPDLVTRDAREWHDLRGYFVRVVAAYPALDHIDAIILSVYPFP